MYVPYSIKYLIFLSGVLSDANFDPKFLKMTIFDEQLQIFKIRETLVNVGCHKDC